MPSIADFMHNYNVRAFEDLDPPVMKVPVVEGAAGTQSLSYKASFITICGETPPSEAQTITTGPDTLSGFNKVKLSVESIPAAARKVRFYKNTVSGYKLLAEVDVSIGQVYDSGQAVSATTPKSSNTSGRPNHLALGFHPGEYGQRQEWMDMQAIFGRSLKNIGDTIFKDGDIVSGCIEQNVSGNTWRFTEGYVYLYGMIHKVASGQVTITGTGKEFVGLRVTETWVNPSQDTVLKAHIDEKTPPEYAQQGADRLVLTLTWVVDEAGQINVREFLNGQPLLKVFRTEMTEMEKKLAQGIYDVSGDFVVKNFPPKCKEHDTDADKFIYVVGGGGKAYVTGKPIATIAPQPIEVPRGRETKAINNSSLEGFSIPGGTVIGTVAEPFNVDGLKLKIKIGSGNYHEVTLSGSGRTAAQVASDIATAVNSYATSGTGLVSCSAVSGKVKIVASAGKSIELATIANDAYSILGFSTGTVQPEGQRIYRANHQFVKQTSDLSFITELVVAVVHDGTDHIDTLPYEVQDILGASVLQADCHDGKYDFQKTIDFNRDGNALDFASAGGTDPDSGTTYYAKIRVTHNATKAVRVRVRVTDAKVVKETDNGQDTIVFTDATSAVEVISGNAVANASGSASDVIRILRVNDSPGQSTSEYSAYALLKNSGALKHDPSQIDWSAAGAPGDGQPTQGATYYVTFEYWRHTTEGDYVSAESYLNDYAEIEIAPNGTWNLRDCIDFRCVNGKVPVPDSGATFDYEFYLGRIDKIALNSDGYFFRIPGAAAEVPVPPVNQTGSLNIVQLTIPPYTYLPSDVTVQTLEMQRRTQVGINELAAKIERLEYYAALRQLEDTATQNPAAAEAKGIFTDAVLGTRSGDVYFDKNSIAFNAAIDQTEQCVRLPAVEYGAQISVDMANSDGVSRIGKVLVFDYQESIYLHQPIATAPLNVNPYEVYGWQGTLAIDPESDFWTDIEQMPVIDLNYDSQMEQFAIDSAERARNITWGAWSMTWDNTGGQATAQVDEATGYHWGAGSVGETTWGLNSANGARERFGTYKSIVPERKLVDVDDRVIDVTVLPFLRTKYPDNTPFEIGLDAEGLVPLTDIACTIDGVLVDITPTGTTVAGSVTYQGKTTVKTNAAGRATAKFTVPEGVTVGAKTVKVFAASDPNLTSAMAVFTSQGFRETHQKTVQGIMSYTERDEVVIETEFHYGDPLSQTFAVTSGIHWLSGVRLFFKKKDASLPVTVEMRTTLNGYPARTVIQTKTLYPADVNVSDDATIGTDFIFPNLVGYEAGEYAFVVIANTQGYELWHAEMGQVDVKTGQVLRQQATDGVEFRSPNNSYWEGFAMCDLTFDILEANFENNCQVVFNNITGIQASAMILAITQFLPVGCNLHWAYSYVPFGQTAYSDWIPFVPGIDTELDEIAEEIKLRADITSSGGTFQIAESGAGIILLLNYPSANYIGHNAQFTDPADKVTMVVDLAVDGTNGAGVRSVTPYYSVDDGEIWVEFTQPAGYVPLAVENGVYKEYKFETPDEKTIEGATNATPIVITSSAHGHKENAIVTIVGVEGNTAANGTFRIKNVTDNTFELTNPTTGANIAGNGAYTQEGTFTLAEFTQLRFRFKLETDNQAVTPKIKRIRGFAA